MRTSIAVVLLLLLLLAVVMSSCAKRPEPVDPGPLVDLPDVAPAGEAPAVEPETVPPADTAPEPAAVVEQVGAPLFEGAQAEGAEVKDGDTLTTFFTDATYKDVKAFYLEKLQTPEWTNNGFEMGVMGGDEWEFKSADESRRVLLKSPSPSSKTEIRFTVKGD